MVGSQLTVLCRQDVLSEALLSFGASSVSVDEEDGPTSSDEVCPIHNWEFA